MKKLLILFLVIASFISKAQNKKLEVGFDIGLMKVESNFFLTQNEKINTRFGGNIGYRLNLNYTFRLGLYKESWDYSSSKQVCISNPPNSYPICFDNSIGSRQNWWSIPLMSEFYVWKRRIKFIAAPNILLGKDYNDISLMGGLGYSWAFSDYGCVKIETLYQSNKLDFWGRKGKEPKKIWLLNIGLQYLL